MPYPWNHFNTPVEINSVVMDSYSSTTCKCHELQARTQVIMSAHNIGKHASIDLNLLEFIIVRGEDFLISFLHFHIEAI